MKVCWLMLERLVVLLASGVTLAASVPAAAVRGLGRFAWLWLRRALSAVLALIVLFEEWGWRPLADLLGQLRRLRLVARIENAIMGLPPYGALIAFALPSLLLLPLKLVGLYLIAQGHKLAAVALIGFAKLTGTAVVARLFLLTKPQLMRIGWFAWSYNRIMPWKEAMFTQIRASWAWRYGRMLKGKVKQTARRAWTRWRPVAQAALAAMRARVMLWRIRRRH